MRCQATRAISKCASWQHSKVIASSCQAGTAPGMPGSARGLLNTCYRGACCRCCCHVLHAAHMCSLLLNPPSSGTRTVRRSRQLAALLRLCGPVRRVLLLLPLAVPLARQGSPAARAKRTSVLTSSCRNGQWWCWSLYVSMPERTRFSIILPCHHLVQDPCTPACQARRMH